MKPTQILKFLLRSLLLSSILMSTTIKADIQLQAGVGGIWYNLAEDGHGLFITIADSDAGPVFVVSWYHYHEGKQIWLLGSSNFQIGDDSITVPMLISSGSNFGANFNPDEVVRSDWGTLTFRFISCDQLVMDYASGITGFGSGSLDLVRLTNTSGVSCQEGSGSVANNASGGLVGRVFDGVRVVSEQLVDKTSNASAGNPACHLLLTLENATSEAKQFAFSYIAKAGGQPLGTSASFLSQSPSTINNVPANQTTMLEGAFVKIDTNPATDLPDIDLSDICNGNIPNIPTSIPSISYLHCDEIDSIMALSISELFSNF